MISRVSVLKKVEARLPEVAVQSAGPRFNPHGEILPYSILGAVEQYQTAKIADGNVVCVFCVGCFTNHDIFHLSLSFRKYKVFWISKGPTAVQVIFIIL